MLRICLNGRRGGGGHDEQVKCQASGGGGAISLSRAAVAANSQLFDFGPVAIARRMIRILLSRIFGYNNFAGVGDWWAWDRDWGWGKFWALSFRLLFNYLLMAIPGGCCFCLL